MPNLFIAKVRHSEFYLLYFFSTTVFSTFYYSRIFTSFLHSFPLYRRLVHSSLFARTAVLPALQMEALAANNCTDIFFSAPLLSCSNHINKSVRAGNRDQDVSDD